MQLIKTFKTLCSPAQIYLAISVLTTMSMCFQNIGNPNVYACGLIKARTPVHNMIYFAFKVLYIFVWTYLLNMLCKKGMKKVSWLLLLLPYILMFIFIGFIMILLKNN
tara:strand:- start:860 stop:1183 length:324 start_codon:yes stop_codon:yes gene_type:complete